MIHTYRSLVPQLHSTADIAIAWFAKEWGISMNGVKIEAQIHRDVDFRPTFSVKANDCSTLCVEVRDSVYAPILDSFVLRCQSLGLPAKLIVAVPNGSVAGGRAEELKTAKRFGIGVLEVDEHGGAIIQQPLLLSLTALQPIDRLAFPSKYRQSLALAEQMFRDGYPEKGCAAVYDELEALFRKFAAKAVAGSWLTAPLTTDLKKSPPWGKLIKEVDTKLKRGGCPCPKEVSETLMAQIQGITPFRNETGHKPKDIAARTKRDRELRTRFESAVNLLLAFITATKGLRL